MAIERKAHATWEGDLRSGSGTFDVGSGAISGQEVTFASRFERAGRQDEPGGADRRGACDVRLDGARQRARPGGPPAHEARDRRGLHARPDRRGLPDHDHAAHGPRRGRRDRRGRVPGPPHSRRRRAARSRTRSAASRSRSRRRWPSRSRARSGERRTRRTRRRACGSASAARSLSYSVRRNSNVPSPCAPPRRTRVSPSSGMPTLPGLSSSVPSGPGRRNCWWLWPKTTSRSRTPASIRSSSGSGCGAKLSTSESGEPWT